MPRPKNKESKPKVEKVMELSDELKEMATKVIDDEDIDLCGAKIAYLFVDPYISKSVAGRCIKANKEFEFISKYNFVIEMSKKLWDELKDETKYILMLHELKHILVIMNDKTGDYTFKVRDHDVQDFGYIIQKYGVDWIKEIKTINSSLNDLTPKEEDGFKL